MRKRNKGRILSRPKNQRTALSKALARSLFLYERITTTEAKAKELRSFAEKLINRAKNNTLANRRILLTYFNSEVTKKLFEEIAPRYKERKGGYVRIAKLDPRKSDGAKMSVIELIK